MTEQQIDAFNRVWLRYPNKDGKKKALKSFISSVKSEVDWRRINKALDNYLSCRKVREGYIKNGSTWFNNWEDWEDFVNPIGDKQTSDNPYDDMMPL